MKHLQIACFATAGLLAGAVMLQAETEESKPGCCLGSPDACSLQAPATNAPVAAAKAQTTCPVMKGNPIDKKLFVDQDGKRIYVCCSGCIGPVKKNFAKYVKQIEAEGIALEAAKPVAQ